jgi:hypothetical protein
MFCAKCGAPLNGATFCASCGTAANATAGVPIQPAPTSYQVPPPQYGLPAKPPTNGLAVGGFVTSLVCLGPVGLILSLVAISQIKKSPTPQGGQGLATAGAIIGGLSSIWFVITIIGAVAAASSSSYYY